MSGPPVTRYSPDVTWFSQYLYGGNGNYSFSCTNVFPPCSNINVSQLYGVQGDNQPANGACGRILRTKGSMAIHTNSEHPYPSHAAAGNSVM